MKRFFSAWAYAASLLALPFLATEAQAQRLLWEHTDWHTGSVQDYYLGSLIITPVNEIMVTGGTSNIRPASGCYNRYQNLVQTWSLTGVKLLEKRGRDVITGEKMLLPAQGNGYWMTATQTLCSPAAIGPQARPYVQRLNARGDTLRGWNLNAASQRMPWLSYAGLLNGRNILTAGLYVVNNRPQMQYQQYALTCSDTATGRVRWQRSYPLLPISNAYQCGLVAAPRGGYLLSGIAQRATNTDLQLYLLETDSLGRQRRQVLLDPLGPRWTSADHHAGVHSLLALPGAGGYLLSGTADSLDAGGVTRQAGFVVRLDTALRVVWAYRHRPGFQGAGSSSQLGYQAQLLPGGAVGLLLSDVFGNNGSPAVYLGVCDLATGAYRGTYVLPSNSQATVIPYAWRWLPDQTLVIAGKSRQVGMPATVSTYSYLARWDFRGTPLATGRAAGAWAGAGMSWAPNPAHGTATLRLPPGGLAPAAVLTLCNALGQAVRRWPLPPAAATPAGAVLDLGGLPPGVYLASLPTPQGTLHQRLVVE